MNKREMICGVCSGRFRTKREWLQAKQEELADRFITQQMGKCSVCGYAGVNSAYYYTEEAKHEKINILSLSTGIDYLWIVDNLGFTYKIEHYDLDMRGADIETCLNTLMFSDNLIKSKGFLPVYYSDENAKFNITNESDIIYKEAPKEIYEALTNFIVQHKEEIKEQSINELWEVLTKHEILIPNILKVNGTVVYIEVANKEELNKYDCYNN